MKSRHIIHGCGSPYDAVVQALKEEIGLAKPVLNPSTTPEDLSSRTLFPHEPSREPTIYSTLLYKKAVFSKNK